MWRFAVCAFTAMILAGTETPTDGLVRPNKTFRYWSMRGLPHLGLFFKSPPNKKPLACRRSRDAKICQTALRSDLRID
jgi:hypothetical protein